MLNAEDPYSAPSYSKSGTPQPAFAREHSISGEIDQDDAWAVIRAYFKQHGLVSQQISSFNRFLSFSV